MCGKIAMREHVVDVNSYERVTCKICQKSGSLAERELPILREVAFSAMASSKGNKRLGKALAKLLDFHGGLEEWLAAYKEGPVVDLGR
jgi:glutaminase